MSHDPDDRRAAAREAGLRWSTDARPGISRRRAGRGWSYRDAEGDPVRDAEVLARIRSLVIPPAWTDVWISPDPRGHLQATGRDARGRKQYRYHHRWRSHRDADKFDRLSLFGAALPEARARFSADLRSPALTRERVLAGVATLLDETLIRVGNTRYAEENETYGLTTLRRDHVDLGTGWFELCFVAKSGVEHSARVDNPRVARLVRRCHELGGQHLFSYESEDGEPVPVGSGDVNDYLREALGAPFSAKAFRTWGGTVAVAERLAGGGTGNGNGNGNGNGASRDDAASSEVDRLVVEAIDEAAARLGNTRAVCRSSYVHPAVVESFRDGSLADAWRSSRGSARQDRAERAVLRVLGP